MKKTVVLAGSYQQFESWRREKGYGPDSVIYVDDNLRAAGLHGNPIVRVGTWYQKDIAYDPRFKGRSEVL